MGCGRRFFRAVTGRSDWVIRGAYGVFYSHTVRQGREGILPSSLAVDLAERFHITLAGFLKPGSMNIYTHPERVIE